MAQPLSAQHNDPFLGTTISDRFKILSLIAKGGMGRVYKAEQSPLGRIVAVKVLHPNYTGDEDPEFSKRFTLEASVVSRLKHPNTVTVYDYGETPEGVYYMVMELLEGRTLHRLIRDEGPLDVGRALHILLQIARSLREAHGQGVIHRDLKPANVFLIQHDDDGDFVKVLDFGLVKNLDEGDAEGLTKTGLFMGSPKYMAPEQIRGDRCTPATDVYALGVLLYEMLVGKVPFDRPNSANLLLAHVNDPVPSIQSVNPAVNVPPALEEIVYRCLSKAPEDRFQSMDELILAVKHAGLMVTGFGPSLTSVTGEFRNSVSAPRAAASNDSLRAAQPLAIASSAPAGTTPLPPPLPSARAAAEAQRNSRVALALTGVLCALLVALAFYAVASKNNGGVTTQHATTVTLVLESDPSGAEVLERGAVIGRTPLRETWTGSRADPAESHTFTFRLANHADAVVTLSGSTLVHLARLQSLTPRPATADAQAPIEQTPTSPPAITQPPPVQTPNVRRPPTVRVVRPPVRGADAGALPQGYRRDPY